MAEVSIKKLKFQGSALHGVTMSLLECLYFEFLSSWWRIHVVRNDISTKDYLDVQYVRFTPRIDNVAASDQ